MKHSEKLKAKYAKEIGAWDWDKIQQECYGNPQQNYCGDIEGVSFLGSILNLFPSGKIYTFWTSNQTAKDMIRDQAYREALEEVAEEHGLYIDHRDDHVFAACNMDINGDYYWTEDGNEFRRGRDSFDSWAEVKASMEAEGYFPGVYWISDYGNISFYQES